MAVMGNHEFNAIAWYMPDPECDGEHLRRRTPKNHKQHKAFLDEAENDSALHREIVGWLPIDGLPLAGLAGFAATSGHSSQGPPEPHRRSASC